MNLLTELSSKYGCGSHPFILFSALVFLFCHCSATPLFYSCYYGRNYTDNSPFQTNLNQVMQSLTSSTPSTGFYSTSAGEYPDQVHGVALCRGDLSADDCKKCLINGATEENQLCPHSTDMNLWYDYCYMRYSDEDFTGSPFGKIYYSCDGNSTASDPNLFGKQMLSLMLNLTHIVMSNSSSGRLFASGDIAGSTANEKIYGMEQCRRDMSDIDCLGCLQALIYYIATTNCSSKDGARVVHGSCTMRYEIYPFVAGTPERPPEATQHVSGERKHKTTIITSAAVLVVLLIVSLAICLLIMSRRNKRKPQVIEEELGAIQPLFCDFNAVMVATNNLSDENKIGGGGFGTVYKGKFRNGKDIAVKSLSIHSAQVGEEEFKNELTMAARIQHANLLRLLGGCAENEQRLFIYEYMPNRSLDKFLFDSAIHTQLDWATRKEIVIGIARGLLYLHEGCHPKIIHGNIKASNILLDADMNPKIADFGVARNCRELMPRSANNVAETSVYMSPEYVLQHRVSEKLDVYSFGILLLEIVSGHSAISYDLSDGRCNFVGHAWRLWKENKEQEFIDPFLDESCPELERLKYMHIGLLCVQDDPNLRPAMSPLLHMLTSDSIHLPAPICLQPF